MGIKYTNQQLITYRILDATILNADVSASAAIAYSKLATLTATYMLVGNSSNVATAAQITGDIAVSNAGVTTIQADAVESSMILDGTVANTNMNALYMKVVTGALDGTGGASNSKIFAWRNTAESANIIVHKVVIDVTTQSSAAALIDVGVSASDATANNLIDGAAIHTAACTRTNLDNTTGGGAEACDDDEYVTGYSDGTQDPADVAGKYYIFYTKVAA